MDVSKIIDIIGSDVLNQRIYQIIKEYVKELIVNHNIHDISKIEGKIPKIDISFDDFEDEFYDITEKMSDDELYMLNNILKKGILDIAYFQNRWGLLDRIAKNKNYTCFQNDLLVTSVRMDDMIKVLEMGYSPDTWTQQHIAPILQAALYQNEEVLTYIIKKKHGVTTFRTKSGKMWDVLVTSELYSKIYKKY